MTGGRIIDKLQHLNLHDKFVRPTAVINMSSRQSKFLAPGGYAWESSKKSGPKGTYAKSEDGHAYQVRTPSPDSRVPGEHFTFQELQQQSGDAARRAEREREAKRREKAEMDRRHADVEAAQERQRGQAREDRERSSGSSRESSRRGTPAGDRRRQSEQQSTTRGGSYSYLDEAYEGGNRQYNSEKMTATD